MEGSNMPRQENLSMAILSMALVILGLLGANPVQAAEVEQVFKFYCAQCHGLEGKGDGPNVGKEFPVDPRNFTKADEMAKLSDADIKNVILDGGPSAGKSPMMPPWGKTLTGEEVDALVKHLRKLCNCTGKPS
jgi:mono/diheme cytochrome c family protein